jgi:hypothetical protein
MQDNYLLNQDKYVLNKELKRIEPKDTLCQFCGQRHSTEMNRNYFAPLFKVKNRFTLIVYNSVRFDKILIGIPRCNQCYVIHQGNSYKGWIISLVSATVLIVLGFVTLGKWGIFPAPFLPAIAILTAPLLTDFLVKRERILSKKEGTKRDPLVRDMVILGWSLTQPSPIW